MSRPQKPKDGWVTVGVNHSTYNGRNFYGEHADDMAELHWRRDWMAWAEQELRILYRYRENIDEALNSGDGVYRP
jgi:hypothetical protein